MDFESRESLTILFEDADSIVVMKPSGLLVHRGEDTSRREPAVLQLLRDQCGRRFYPVHRLDRATSGALMLAKSSEAAAAISAAWLSASCQKTYLAIVRGWPASPMLIERSLRDLDASDGRRQAAVTRARTLATIELSVAVEDYPRTRYALLALEPETGRRHQLRRHLKQLHHPIIGDTVYGRGAHNRFFRERLAADHLLLHHALFAWTDLSGVNRQVAAPLPRSWRRILAAFAWTRLCEQALLR